MAEVTRSILMGTTILVTFSKVKLMDTGYTNGRMERSSMDSGRKELGRVKAYGKEQLMTIFM
jgi:hypothetical protein